MNRRHRPAFARFRVEASPLFAKIGRLAQRGRCARPSAVLALKRLVRLARDEGVALHLVGHSAGSILIGALLERLRKAGLKAASCHLYAPACTVPFALRTYAKAIEGGALSLKRLHLDLLEDERERADNCGTIAGAALYGRSLLYLVSFALET